MKFDLTGCPEIDPGGLLLLMYHGLELKKRGWGTYLGGLGGTVKQVLLNLDHYLAPKDARASFDAPPGDFLLRGIDGKESMVAELMAWARTVQQATQASDERVALWQMQIAEVTTNGFQHGPRLGPMSGDLLINGKSYTERGEVQLAAIDFGAGIPRVIEIIGRPAKCVGDGDLIAYACEKGVTSRCVPQNQGAGLDSLIQTVRSSGGRLLMLSNNGLLYTAADEQQVRNLKPRKKYGDQVLNGTLTVINLRIRSDDRACQGH
ncbi:MAG: hypothetical protein R3B70_22485 [Polyangiaceae bacterium]